MYIPPPESNFQFSAHKSLYTLPLRVRSSINVFFTRQSFITFLTWFKKCVKSYGIQRWKLLKKKSLIIKLPPTWLYSFKSKYITLTSFVSANVLQPWASVLWLHTQNIPKNELVLCLPTCLILWTLFQTSKIWHGPCYSSSTYWSHRWLGFLALPPYT